MNASVTAWRGGVALLCYGQSHGWHTTGELHPYLTQRSSKRSPGCYRLLSQLAGRGLVPVRPIGFVRLADFLSHRRREHGGLS